MAAWLWREGYALARNISLTTGSMGDYCNGTEYSFVELSHKIQNSSAGIEQLFQYWRHTTKVAVFSLFFFFSVTSMTQVPMPIVSERNYFQLLFNLIFFFGIQCLIYSKLNLRTHVCLNLQSWTKVLGTFLQYSYFSFISWFPLKTVHPFRNCLAVLPPSTLYNCLWGEGRGWTFVNWKTSQKCKSDLRRFVHDCS